MSASRKSLPKRIIICCDGTWQSAVDGKENIPSNVTRLARCLERVGVDKSGKEWQQVVWYDSGVGTTSGVLGRTLEGAVGQGLEGNVIEAYNFCVLNYSPGDQIMCFGFSRGAYTARSIAGVISDIGVCTPDSLQHFHEIWKLYKENETGGRFWGTPAYYDFIYGVEAEPEKQLESVGSEYKAVDKIWLSEPHPEWELYEEASRDIEVVGVYDTVGALGMPSVMGYQPKLLFGPDKLGYHNVRLSPNIKNAFQALAIDEHRKAFSPTVWHLPARTEYNQKQLDDQKQSYTLAQAEWDKVRGDPTVHKDTRAKLKKDFQDQRTQYLRDKESTRPHSNLLQVWFPGVHINVGGGSSDTLLGKGDLEELSNMTFSWMLDQICQYVTIDKKAYIREAREHFELVKQLNLKAEANEKRIAAQKKKKAESGWGEYILGGLKYAANKVAHPLTPAPSTDITRRVQDWGTGEIIESYTAMYYLNGSWRRVPGNYTVDNKNKPELGVTNEYIHPSIGYRIEMSKNEPDKKKRYRPAAFAEDEFVRRWSEEKQVWEYDVKGSAQPITEYRLQPAREGADINDLPYERYAVIGDRAQKYVDDLDRQYGYSKQMMGNPPDFV